MRMVLASAHAPHNMLLFAVHVLGDEGGRGGGDRNTSRVNRAINGISNHSSLHNAPHQKCTPEAKDAF